MDVQKRNSVFNATSESLLCITSYLIDCQVHRLGRKTVELLLMNNEDVPNLLLWVIDRCYTGSRLVQECSFTALAKVFSKRSVFWLHAVLVIA